MEIGYLPLDHLHKMIDEITPDMRWDGKKDIKEWQKDAREKLKELIGFGEIEKHAVPLTYEIESDFIREDNGCREIRFRFVTEENVTVPCHLVIPKEAKKPLPVIITLQGHSTGMHISLGRPKFPGDEEDIADGDRDFAVRAVKEGVCAIALEQRCFGECGRTEKGSCCRQAAMRAILLGRTIVGERVWDVMKLIDLLQTEFQDVIDKDKIMCMGNSGGGTTTTYVSAIDERIKVSVPSCAVCRYADSIAAVLHCECNYVPNIAHHFDMGDLCTMVAPRSLVVVSGTTAKACVEVGKTTYSALGANENIIHVVGAFGHRFYADDAWPHIHAALKKL